MKALAILLSMTASAPHSKLPVEVVAWRAEKDSEMRSVHSPLSYAGTRELSPGRHLLGDAEPSELRFSGAGLPGRALFLDVLPDRWHLEPLAPLVSLNGTPTGPANLRPGDRIEVGALTLEVQGPNRVTVYDRSRAAFVGYRGLRYLPFDPAYRVTASFEPAAPGRTLILETTQNQRRELPLRGVLHFNLLNQPHTLEAFALGEKPNDYFVIFRDPTNGEESYGAGRFVWVPGAIDGKTTLDFNLAWNPLCAYSDQFNCPLAPAANRLPVRIPVGEGRYAAH